MMTIERILCAVERERDEVHILSRACAIARPFRARVDALLLRPGPAQPTRSAGVRVDFTPELDAQREAELLFAELIRKTDAERLEPQAVGSAQQAILAQSAECGADLIVLGARQTLAYPERRPSLADEVARCATRPILTVPSTEGNLSVRHILLPVDFSSATTRAVEWAALLARGFSATVRLLHAVGSSALRGKPVRRGASVGHGFASAQVLLGELEQRLRSNGVSCETTLAEQGTTHAILACRDREECDLIVMGMHHHESEGTVASGVVSSIRRRARVPVLSITTPESEATFTLDDPARNASAAGQSHALSARAARTAAENAS
jgi:nucleotide-binding universal stress UspA family protein